MAKLKDMSDRERARFGHMLTLLLGTNEELKQAVDVMTHSLRLRLTAQTRAFEILRKEVETDADMESLQEVFRVATLSLASAEGWRVEDLPEHLANTVMPFLVRVIETAADANRSLEDQLAAAKAVYQSLPAKTVRIDNRDVEQRPGVCSVIASQHRRRVNDEVELLWKWALRQEHGIVLLGGGKKAHDAGSGVILPPKLWLKAKCDPKQLKGLLLSSLERLGRPCDLVVVYDAIQLGRSGEGCAELSDAAAVRKAAAAMVEAVTAVNATGVLAAFPTQGTDRDTFIAQLEGELGSSAVVHPLTFRE
jgi:hypothetical protein